MQLTWCLFKRDLDPERQHHGPEGEGGDVVGCAQAKEHQRSPAARSSWERPGAEFFIARLRFSSECHPEVQLRESSASAAFVTRSWDHGVFSLQSALPLEGLNAGSNFFFHLRLP